MGELVVEPLEKLGTGQAIRDGMGHTQVIPVHPSSMREIARVFRQGGNANLDPFVSSPATDIFTSTCTRSLGPSSTGFHHVSPCFTMFHHVSPCFTMFHPYSMTRHPASGLAMAWPHPTSLSLRQGTFGLASHFWTPKSHSSFERLPPGGSDHLSMLCPISLVGQDLVTARRNLNDATTMCGSCWFFGCSQDATLWVFHHIPYGKFPL